MGCQLSSLPTSAVVSTQLKEMDTAVAAGDLPKVRSELERYSVSAYVFSSVGTTQNNWNLLHLASWYDQPEVLKVVLTMGELDERRRMVEAKDVVWTRLERRHTV